MRQRMHVVQRRAIEFQSRTAVNAAPAAVAHRCALDRPLLWAGGDWFCPAADTRRAGEGDSVELPTSGQCHLAKKATPRSGNLSRSGVSRRSMKNGNSEEPSHCVALVIALRSVAVDTLDVGRVGSLASGGTRDRIVLTVARAIQMQCCASSRKWRRQPRRGVTCPSLGTARTATHHAHPRSPASQRGDAHPVSPLVATASLMTTR
jgi:hypothetical protein